MPVPDIIVRPVFLGLRALALWTCVNALVFSTAHSETPLGYEESLRYEYGLAAARQDELCTHVRQVLDSRFERPWYFRDSVNGAGPGNRDN
jgi:hypothetical protein